MIGEVLNGFKLTVKLGESDTGESYVAEHQVSSQKATAKVLRVELSSDARLLAECFAQVKAASQVKHPCTVALYAAGVHPSGRAFLVMEHLAGRTLAGSLADLGRVDDSESLADIGGQLASLLGAVHGAGIVHGALHPDSIFLTFPLERGGKPLVKVLDFGMARLHLALAQGPVGRLPGTLLYLPPESAARQTSVDPRADVYSLGCILFEMACGQPPFAGDRRDSLLGAQSGEPSPSLAYLGPSVPPPMVSLIGRMLSKSLDARPRSMAEVASVLDGLRGIAPLAPSPPIPPTLMVPGSRDQSPPRIQDPTALLPPAPRPSPPAGLPVKPTTWLGRVQHRTAILDAPVQLRRRPRPPPLYRHGSRPAVSLPVVILTAAIIVAAGAVLLLLRGTRPPSAIEVSPPVGKGSDPGPDSGQKAPSLAPLPEPAAGGSSLPAETAYEGEDEPPQDDKAESPSPRSRPQKRPPVKRW